MTHYCEIKEGFGCCIEENEKLLIQEYVTELGMIQGRKYEVNFCPVCGFKMPNKSPFNFLHIPYAQADDSISQFSYNLSVAIAQMNHNVELIKCFMSSQCTQNECFIHNEMELRKKIARLEKIISKGETNEST